MDKNPRQPLWRRDDTPSAGFWLLVTLALAALAPTLLALGWREPLLHESVGRWVQKGALAGYLLALAWPALRGTRDKRAALRAALADHRSDATVAGLTLLLSWWWPALVAGTIALALIQLLRGFLLLSETRFPPGLLFVGSFAGLVVVGTGLLMMPAATPEDQPINFTDALFTITSAISQTGLVVRDTGTGFTRFGQVILLIWIQVGALGVIVFGALLAMALGSGFGLRATQSLAEPTESGWTGALSLRRLVFFIIVVTHAFEAVGAAALFIAWPAGWDGAPGLATVGDRLFHCVFFSVSAFCSAGFVTTANSLEGLRWHGTSHFVIAPLIVLGSIGFPVLDNLRRVAWARLRRRRVKDGALIRLNLNSKIILTATAAVYLLGYVFIVLGELLQTHEPLRLVLLDAHFMTINRTAGFNTVAPSEMGLLSRLTLILLMFIGGSPVSVAGGIKMMVFAVLAMTVWATITGRSQTTAFGRTISDALVRKSATLIVLSLAAIMAVTGVLAATETGDGRFSLDELLFDATSAVATTGYSVGVAMESSTPGRIALTIGMFIGRVGPLAVLAALLGAAARRRPRYEYPTEDVVIY